MQVSDKSAGTGSKARLALGAVGVVYGDIGTSPLYALREAIRAGSGGDATEAELLGILSIIVWSLILVVAVKYALLVLRADNRGEGGTLSLMALALAPAGRWRISVLMLGMLGAALFIGDALITPAISVLSALEGLEVAAPVLSAYVVALTVAILLALFALQRLGTGWVASVFGPITAAWLLVIGLAGLFWIASYPVVLWAFDPTYALRFLFEHRVLAIAVIGAAFLAVTGAEALYADLGHFGRRPIVTAWFALVFPCLLASYFGQAAYILSNDGVIGQPLFEMVPGWAALPLVILATAATIIASQAVITGAFSMVQQAIQLRLLPRMDVQHTSATQSGQIFMPQVNLLLAFGVIVLVLEFGTSADLAGAYGISVAGEMVVTALLLLVVMRGKWKCGLFASLVVIVPFLLIDVGFLAANLAKVSEGGWVSLMVAGVVLAVMMTWRRGSALLFARTRKTEVPLVPLVARLAGKPPTIVPGTAIFLTADPESAPTALMHSLKHYKVLHETNVILTVITTERPRVSEEKRVEVEALNPLFKRVTLRFGYMEQPNIPRALGRCRQLDWKFDIMSTSFFLSRRTLKPVEGKGLSGWQERLFIVLARNATDASRYFHIPTGRAVEIGTQVAI